MYKIQFCFETETKICQFVTSSTVSLEKSFLGQYYLTKKKKKFLFKQK